MFYALKRLVLLVGLPSVLGFGACGALQSFDELNNPSDDVALARCREEGRANKRQHQDAAGAYAVYFECTKEAGLR